MPKIEIPCQQCKKPLFRFPSHIKGKKYGPFCDRHCLGKYRTATLTGDFAANFKNGFRKDRSYFSVSASWHPNKGKHGYVYLHRLIAEARMGRFLTEKEVVHHKDHNPQNNHWDNLEVMTQSEHSKKHAIEKERNKNGTF